MRKKQSSFFPNLQKIEQKLAIHEKARQDENS